MKLNIEVIKSTPDSFELTIGTRYFFFDSIDKVLERISEALLEEEDTKSTF